MDIVFKNIRSFSHIVFILTQILLATAYADGKKELHSPNHHVYRFDIPNQPLGMGLIEFALQSKTTVVVTNDTLYNFPSVPVIGYYPIDKALEQLLANSPFSFSYIEKDKQFLVTDQHKQNKKPVTLTDNATQQVEEVLVSASQLPLKYHSISSSLTHGNVSSYDSARFINVFTPKLILDQSTEELSEILRNTSGITPADGLADSNNDYFVRGFPRNAVYIDGFRLEPNTGIKIHPTTIGAVEVLKGPSTLLYGQSEPGGVVNIVRKRPLRHAQYRLAIGLGSNEKRFTSIDFTDSVSNSLPSLNYRFIYVNENQETLRDLNDISLEIYSPSLSWSKEKTTFNLMGEYQNKKQTREQGALVFVPTGEALTLLSLDAPSSLARPNFNSTLNLISADLSQALTGTWSFRSSYSKQKELRLGVRANESTLITGDTIISREDLEPEQNFILVSGIIIPIPEGTSINEETSQLFEVATLRSIFDEQTTSQASYLTANVEGSPTVLSATHHIRFGMDKLKRLVKDTTVLEERSDITELSLNRDSLTTPQELINNIQTNSSIQGALTKREQQFEYLDYGIYLQDTIEITSNFSTSVGGRYTETKASRTSDNRKSKFPSFRELTTDIGATYRLGDTTAYLNYSESTKSNYVIDDFDTFPKHPELSHQIELGVKLLNLESGLIATASIYQIEKRNVTTIIFDEGLRRASFDHTQKSEGLDLEVNYQPSPSISIISSASLIDPQNTSGQYSGNIPPLATRSTASIYTNIELTKTKNTQLNFSAGLYHVGNRYTNQSNSAELENYQLIDIGFTYRFSAFKMEYVFRSGLKNVLDEQYTSSTEGSFRINSGSGRTFISTLEITL